MKAFLVLMAAVPILSWVVSFAAVNLYMHSRAVDVLERWAKREGYRLARRSRLWFFRGPHFWFAESGHVVFKVTVEDHDGLGRVAWVDCGDTFWEDDPRPQVVWDYER